MFRFVIHFFAGDFICTSTSAREAQHRANIYFFFRSQAELQKPNGSLKGLAIWMNWRRSAIDPIAHFKEEAKRRSVRQKLTIEAFLDEHHRFDTPYMKGNPESRQVKALGLSLGMLPLSQIYHELEIGYFWDNRRRYTKAKYNHNTIFQALVFGRILFPGSKLSTWRSRQRLLSNMDFTDDDVYRSLPFFASHKTALQKHLHQKVSKLYGRDTSLLYYDVTNYYWETDNEDERRKRGVSKEHRPEPIIQMGLLMDSNDLPISYGLFSGNTNDSLTLSPMMGEVDETLKIQGVIYIADSGVISGDNRVEILVNKGGYIFSNLYISKMMPLPRRIFWMRGYVHLKEGSFIQIQKAACSDNP